MPLNKTAGKAKEVLNERISHVAKKGEKEIRQRLYWEHLIRDDEDYQRPVDHIHFKPVKQRYIKTPAAFSHSGQQRYIRAGIIQTNCAGMMI